MTYAEHALQIFDAGYSPLPLIPAAKGGLRFAGFTGYAGINASRADVQTWIEDFPGDNVAARLPVNVIGIDVDAYGGKTGATTFDDLNTKFGSLPRTWKVSSRHGDVDYDGVSGIFLFRIPAELADKADDAKAGWISSWPHVDLIRFGHRHVVAPGSMHSRGTKYQVHDETSGEINELMPNVSDLPMLPAAWCDALLNPTSGRERIDKPESQWWTDGKPCTSVLTRLGQAISELDGGRHNSCIASVLALTRLGEQGHEGVRTAIDALHGSFIAAVTSGEAKRTSKQADKEWKGFIAGVDAKIETKGLTLEKDRGCCGFGEFDWTASLPVEGETTQEAQPRHFTSIPFSEITERETLWLVDELIPESDAVILLGEEGIGKGLWWSHIIGKVTTSANPIHVLIIVSEDDPERTVKPRLVASGADVSKVHLMTADLESLTGVPLIPGHTADVLNEIERTGSKLVIIDPWMSVVPSKLQIKDTQQARQALDPILKLARQTGATFILVTHTNRTATGSSRDKYGGTVALRQAGRVCLMALQDPEDDSMIYVGVEKSNLVGKGAAIKYQKSGDGAAWSLTPTDDPAVMSISDLYATFSRDNDERSTDKWTQVALIASKAGGIVTRAQIIEAYDDNIKSADKAINRWRYSKPPRLLPEKGLSGVFEVNLPPIHPPSIHHITTGGMGGSGDEVGVEPPVPPVIETVTSGGLWGVDAATEPTPMKFDRPSKVRAS